MSEGHATHRFVEALEHGVMRVRACADCSAQQTLDPIFCQACGSPRLIWSETSGRGRVHARSEVHRAPSPAFRALVPYVLVLVDLDDGGRLMAHGATDLAIGAAVVATIFDHAGEPLVRFVAAGDDA